MIRPNGTCSVLDTTQYYISRVTLFCVKKLQYLEQNPLLLKKRHPRNGMLSSIQPSITMRYYELFNITLFRFDKYRKYEFYRK